MKEDRIKREEERERKTEKERDREGNRNREIEGQVVGERIIETWGWGEIN